MLVSGRQVAVCIAKKVYGNHENGFWYCIYTAGDRRHEHDFILQVAHNVFNIPTHAPTALESSVSKLFRMDFAQSNATAKILPADFTGGTKVWVKQFSLGNLDKKILEEIANDEDCFTIAAIDDSNPTIAQEYYTL